MHSSVVTCVMLLQSAKWGRRSICVSHKVSNQDDCTSIDSCFRTRSFDRYSSLLLDTWLGKSRQFANLSSISSSVVLSSKRKINFFHMTPRHAVKWDLFQLYLSMTDRIIAWERDWLNSSSVHQNQLGERHRIWCDRSQLIRIRAIKSSCFPLSLCLQKWQINGKKMIIVDDATASISIGWCAS